MSPGIQATDRPRVWTLLDHVPVQSLNQVSSDAAMYGHIGAGPLLCIIYWPLAMYNILLFFSARTTCHPHLAASLSIYQGK